MKQKFFVNLYNTCLVLPSAWWWDEHFVYRETLRMSKEHCGINIFLHVTCPVCSTVIQHFLLKDAELFFRGKEGIFAWYDKYLYILSICYNFWINFWKIYNTRKIQEKNWHFHANTRIIGFNVQTEFQFIVKIACRDWRAELRILWLLQYK
jgi:hypothetical protein